MYYDFYCIYIITKYIFIFHINGSFSKYFNHEDTFKYVKLSGMRDCSFCAASITINLFQYI